MDSERFDGLVRSFGQSRSRRQTLRSLAGAGALVALLAAKPVAAGKAVKPKSPHNAPNNPSKGQPGGGPLGSSGPSPDCDDQCQDACREQCREALNTCIEDCDPVEDCFKRLPGLLSEEFPVYESVLDHVSS